MQDRILVSSFSITVKLKFFSTHVTIIFNKSLNLGETCQGSIVVSWYKKYRTAASFLTACRHPVRSVTFNPQRPSGYFIYHRWSIQKFFILPTQCVCVQYGYKNKEQLFPYSTALTDWFYSRDGEFTARYD